MVLWALTGDKCPPGGYITRYCVPVVRVSVLPPCNLCRSGLSPGNIVIVDYGTGNLGSIRNVLKYIGVESVVSAAVDDVLGADKLILSGVGAFDNGMRNLEERGLIPILREKVLVRGTPILGICLGTQLFTRRSEEGGLPGLGWIAADTIRFRFAPDQRRLRIPHMGWNLVQPKKECPLLAEMPAEPRFYFVHSYHLVCDDEQDVLTTTNWGYDFASAVARDNIYGVQFHPEKSHKYGIRLVTNFVELV